MSRAVISRVLQFLCLGFAWLSLSSCSSVAYYWQAINGQFAIVSREKPINKLLVQKTTTPQLKKKLELVERARRFASAKLHLTDNGSYTTYADLERPYVTWNVVATPALSIKPKHWCYVFAGCFNYRGYFHEKDAIAFAKKLKKQGYDVAIGGAWAYSTLGWFDDPILNTMLDHDNADVIGTLFHELGHQTVYVKDDSSFNESFANTVEQVGLRRWYAQAGKPALFQQYLRRQKQRKAVLQMLEATREKLRAMFAEHISRQTKHRDKQVIFADLKREYLAWRKHHHYSAYDNWMKQKLNNADLAMIATYSDKIPAFLAMLASVKGNLPAFYEEARRIGALPPKQRNAALTAFSQRGKKSKV